MQFNQLLSPELTFIDCEGISKKRVLENSSKLIAERTEGQTAELLFSGLLSREKLGSTGIGQGIAIPHCRIQDLEHATAALIKLKDPIDFDAIDNAPVDILFLLLVPEEACDEHLNTLARLAEVFSDDANLSALRNCSEASQLYDTALELLND
mgnify:FL=1